MTARFDRGVSKKRRVTLRALAAASVGIASSAQGWVPSMQGIAIAKAEDQSPIPRQDKVPRRVIVLNWDLTEMLLSLGVTPVGIPAPAWYSQGVVVPPLPASVVDVGLLFQPNYDLLYELKPDLIVITPAHAAVRASFERIAPTMTLGTYVMTPQPYPVMCREFMTLASRLGLDATAQSLIDATDTLLEGARTVLQASMPAGGYPEICIAELVDDRHLRVYGEGSLFDEILRSLGLRNAAASDAARKQPALVTSRSGSAVIELEQLETISHAHLLWTGPDGAQSMALLQRNPLWRQLPMSRDGQATVLPVISATGALISVQRFARAVTHSMQQAYVL